MSYWLCFFGAIAVAILAHFGRTVWRAHRTTQSLLRLATALVEPEEFFALVDLSTVDSHFLERHGPMFRSLEVLQRARTGRLDVSGHIGEPVASARWFRHEDLLRAVASAAEHWAANIRPSGGRFVFAFDHDIGEGYRKGGAGPIATKMAAVVIRNGSVLTAYPVIIPMRATHPLISRQESVFDGKSSAHDPGRSE